MNSKQLAVVATVAASITLSGCGFGSSSSSKSYTFDSASAVKAEKVLPSWVPDSASEVTLKQRTTGDARIMRYTGPSPSGSSCQRIAKPGTPSNRELAIAYASDSVSKAHSVDDYAKTAALKAKWWPAGTEKRVTQLCQRWWVVRQGSHAYAFAPETHNVLDDPRS